MRTETAGSSAYCSMHYKRSRAGTDMDAPKRESLSVHRPCDVEGCDRRLYAKGFCSLHYNRLRTTGDVGPAGLTQLAPGTRTRYVDPRSGYVYTYVVGEGKGKLEHRVVMEQMLGRPLDSGENVHHINGLRGDNRPENLELWIKSPQPAGQRADDLVAFVCTNYPEAVDAFRAGRSQLRLIEEPK